MESPFMDVVVVPAYGQHQAQILWRMRPGWEAGVFTVLRSPDGLNDWREIGRVDRGSHFVDPAVITEGRLNLLYYQVRLEQGGQTYASSVINTLGAVSRQEFGAAHFIMQQEYRKLSQCTRILICKLRTTAPVCAQCVDPDTGQGIGTALCQSCYGTGFAGGYWPPVVSFMQLLTQSPVVQLTSADGAGTNDPVAVSARILAYPQLVKSDLLIDAAADKRYLVETQELSLLKGKVPLVATASLVLLRQSDVRYKFPLSA